MDLRRESDVEQLRRIALAQQVQIEQLLRVLNAKCKELEALKGDPKELQQTLELLQTLTKKAQEAAPPPSARTGRDRSKDKPRGKFGPKPQPALPVEPMLFELDDADRVCPSCGGELSPMTGQFETSELIDVIEVSYRLVQVQQQKYVCRCGSCVETAPGPERAAPGSRYSLGFAIKVATDKYLCLLYTSDAADERSSVDLGGRRIIKKKKSCSLRRAPRRVTNEAQHHQRSQHTTTYSK